MTNPFDLIPVLARRAAACLMLLAATAWAQPGDWSFTVSGDMRRYVVYEDIHGWDHACRAMLAEGPGAFLVSPGDIDQQYTSNPGDYCWDIVEQEIGAGFPYFPGVGNHEAGHAPTMDWLRVFDMGGPAYDVNPGPAGCANTTYSWDHGDAHFVMLNECFDGVDDLGAITGNWNATLDAWLRADLAAAASSHVFVFGHFPAYPQADRDTGLLRHATDTDFNAYNDGEYRDALWTVLREYDVTAYICAHSHVASVVEIDGVWQVDHAHARGPRNPLYHGPSTFLRFLMGADGSVTLETWRQPYTEGVGNEAPYSRWHVDVLRDGTTAVPDTPTAARIVDVAPNPFNPRVAFRIEGGAASGRVEIADLRGRVVRVLHEGPLPDDGLALTWDGLDAAGRSAPSAAYHIVLSADGLRRMRTVSLLR